MACLASGVSVSTEFTAIIVVPAGSFFRMLSCGSVGSANTRIVQFCMRNTTEPDAAIQSRTLKNV